MYQKLYQILQDNKDEFKKIMRYRWNGWIVPQQIEKQTKEYISDRDISLSQKEFSNFSITKDNEWFSVHYDNHMFKELPESWNIYDHMISQDIFLKKIMKYDLDAKIISQDDYENILILNLRHDQPEYITGDITVYAKSQDDYLYENKLTHELIDQLPLLTISEKDSLHHINKLQEDKNWLFKFYERMRFLEDAILFLRHQTYVNNAKHPCIEDIYNAIAKLESIVTLPNEKKIDGKNLPSWQYMINTYKWIIQSCIIRCDDYIFNNRDDKKRWEITKSIWNTYDK